MANFITLLVGGAFSAERVGPTGRARIGESRSSGVVIEYRNESKRVSDVVKKEGEKGIA